MGSFDYDLAVVGGGIVGLATAYSVLRVRPGLRVVIVEKERAIAAHQSSHNSGVIHAGVYYAPGSLKAELCQEGKAQLEMYAAERGIPLRKSGKLIVAVDRSELDRLRALEERGLANGVTGLRRISASEIPALEPHAVGVAALHSPTTGVISYLDVCETLRDDVSGAGADIRLGAEVISIADGDRGAVLTTPRSEISAAAVVCCGGLQADRLAAMTEPVGTVHVVPFRGTFRTLIGEAADWIRGNIYPVPDPRFPFLGVHFTRRINGETWAGPTAFLAFAREKYTATGFDRRDAFDAVAFPGLRRFVWSNLGTSWDEARRELSVRAFLASAARYVPTLERRHIGERTTGVRAQAMEADGTLVEDFRVIQGRSVLHVVNAPSPAATASLAIGRRLADRLIARLDG